MNKLAAPHLSTEDRLAFTKWICHEEVKDAGVHRAERLDCDAGFSLVRSWVSAGKTYSERCNHEGSERLLVIAFGLSGQSDFQDRRKNRLTFTANRTTISIFREGEGKRSYSADKPVQQLRLVVSESALMRYIGEERTRRLLGAALGMHENLRQISFSETGNSEHLRHFKHPSIAQQDGLSQRIRALSLLSEQLQLLAPAPITAERLRAKDMDKLELIEAFMRDHLDKPISNAFLCTRFNISEYQLKACFRQAYDTSPAQHLQHMRMHRAHELLVAGCRVSETAYRLGYQHPNNLSAAFIRFFGYAPKSVRNKQH